MPDIMLVGDVAVPVEMPRCMNCRCALGGSAGMLCAKCVHPIPVQLRQKKRKRKVVSPAIK